MLNAHYLSIVLTSLFVFITGCTASTADESQSGKSSVSLATFIKESGFNDDDTESLLRFGTPALKKQYEDADEFDREDIQKKIKNKQDEIKSLHFFIEVPYFTDELNVDGDNTNVRLVIPVKYFNNLGYVQKFDVLRKLEFKNKIFEKASFDNFTFCHPLVKPQYAGIINELITDIDVDLGKQLAEEGEKAIYMKANPKQSILLFSAVGTKEAVKNIVRQKDAYRVRIELTNLYFIKQMDMPEIYYFYSLLKKERYISSKVSISNDTDTKQPDVWVTNGTKKIPAISADITKIEFIETKK
ncbi:MAG: hypothetical protein LBG58_16475 [Planctomycetaceae bacterium]|jgi:hypothetical protein|nr:hypothetical protein [Planctomycetaceae bacterium]